MGNRILICGVWVDSGNGVDWLKCGDGYEKTKCEQ